MRQRIIGRQRRQRKSRSNRLFKLPSIAQGAHQAMMRLEMLRVSGDCFAKRLHRIHGVAGGKQVHAFVRQVVGALLVDRGHAVFRIKSERGAIITGARRSRVKSHTEYLVFETKKRREMVHITDTVEQVVRRSGVRDGLCFVSPMHITAAVYVNDHESGLIEDIGKWLEELAPARPDYKHHQTGEDNGDAHLKSLLLHHETTLPVTNGKLDLGTWQRVFYAEFDGQRRKRVIVKVLGIE